MMKRMINVMAMVAMVVALAQGTSVKLTTPLQATLEVKPANTTDIYITGQGYHLSYEGIEEETIQMAEQWSEMTGHYVAICRHDGYNELLELDVNR